MRLVGIAVLLGYLAFAFILGLGSLTSQTAGTFPSASQILIAAFALADVAAIGVLAFTRGKVPAFAAGVFLTPAILIAGFSLRALFG